MPRRPPAHRKRKRFDLGDDSAEQMTVFAPALRLLDFPLRVGSATKRPPCLPGWLAHTSHEPALSTAVVNHHGGHTQPPTTQNTHARWRRCAYLPPRLVPAKRDAAFVFPPAAVPAAGAGTIILESLVRRLAMFFAFLLCFFFFCPSASPPLSAWRVPWHVQWHVRTRVGALPHAGRHATPSWPRPPLFFTTHTLKLLARVCPPASTRATIGTAARGASAA